jgi:hypothetical protein
MGGLLLPPLAGPHKPGEQTLFLIQLLPFSSRALTNNMSSHHCSSEEHRKYQIWQCDSCNTEKFDVQQPSVLSTDS